MAATGTCLALLTLLLWAMALGPAEGKRKEPPPPLPAVVQALNPSGLRISVLDEEGVDLVIVNANINKPIEAKETGQMSETLFEPHDGFWTLETPSQELKPKDVVFYWIYVSSKYGRRNLVGHHVISEFVNASCKPSITTVNGKPVCKGDLIIDDNFDSLNTTAWNHRVHLPASINRAFASYVADPENSFVKDGSLHLKATLIEDEAVLSEPVKVDGGVHVVYQRGLRKGAFESGEIGVMRVRGNADLRDDNGKAFGANVNHVHIGINTCNRVHFDELDKYMPKGLYSDEFHTYAVTWTPREIKYEFDGNVIKTIKPPVPDGFLGIDAYRNCAYSNWERGSFMAPFDTEFYIKFLLEVGGFHIFPDGSKSGENSKPWRDFTPRLHFSSGNLEESGCRHGKRLLPN